MDIKVLLQTSQVHRAMPSSADWVDTVMPQSLYGLVCHQQNLI